MRVGILTFHEGINHGGFFQAWCLRETIRSFGVEAEFVDYKNRRHWLNEYRAFLLTPNPRRLLNNIRKIRNFRKDQRRMGLGRLTTNPHQIDFSRYDVVVVGSDIVWNYAWPFLGRDPIYFGTGIDARLVAYAPSVGGAKAEDPVPDYVRPGLARFEALSVRDEHSRDVIERIDGRCPELVLDPTMICDRDAVEPMDIGVPYLLVYAFRLRPDEIAQAKRYAQAHGLKTVCIGYPQRWCDIDRTPAGPFEWLGWFQGCSAVLTSTFHGTLFSLRAGKPFAVSENPAIAAKVRSILGRCGLTDRILGGEGALAPLLDRPLDRNAVAERLAPAVEASRDYLRKALHVGLPD